MVAPEFETIEGPPDPPFCHLFDRGAFRVDQLPVGTGEALPDLVDGHAGVHGRDPTPTEADHQKRRARRGCVRDTGYVPGRRSDNRV